MFPYVPGPYGIAISLPVFARPVSCGEFTRFVSVALVSSPKRLASSGLVLFDLHLSITKTYSLSLVAFLGYYNVFFSGVTRSSLRFVVPAYPGSL